MRLFTEIEQKKLCNLIPQNTEVTEVTEVTSPKSLGKRGYKIQGQEVTEVTTRKSLEKSDNTDLFTYLLSDIQSGGAYSKLWPQVREYCRRTLDRNQYQQLENAYRGIGPR